MSPNPNEQAAGTAAPNLLGALQAVHFVMAQLERQASIKIWNTPPKNQQKVIDCIMVAARDFTETIKRCEGPATDSGPGGGTGGSGGGQGPNCRPGFHEEFGICVPDPL